MRWRKHSKNRNFKEIDNTSYFPKFALKKSELVLNFESDDAKLLRANLILNKKDLPFVYGYLYSFNGNYFDNQKDLEFYNEFLLNNLYVLKDNGAYSVDGRFFKNVALAKKYNENITDYYYADFGWIANEVCEQEIKDITVLKRR